MPSLDPAPDFFHFSMIVSLSFSHIPRGTFSAPPCLRKEAILEARLERRYRPPASRPDPQQSREQSLTPSPVTATAQKKKKITFTSQAPGPTWVPSLLPPPPSRL